MRELADFMRTIASVPEWREQAFADLWYNYATRYNETCEWAASELRRLYELEARSSWVKRKNNELLQEVYAWTARYAKVHCPNDCSAGVACCRCGAEWWIG